MRDIGGRERCRGHLVEQRREEMKIAPVDQGDAGRGVAQHARAGEPAKAGADDDDARMAPRRVSGAALQVHVQPP